MAPTGTRARCWSGRTPCDGVVGARRAGRGPPEVIGPTLGAGGRRKNCGLRRRATCCSPPSMVNFPSTWPPDCPPASAAAAMGTVYRVVHNPWAADDFRTYDQIGLSPSAPQCKRLSLSVFNTRAAACHQASKYPRLGNSVAALGLTPSMGRLSSPSPTGHQEWWYPTGFDPTTACTGTTPCP